MILINRQRTRDERRNHNVEGIMKKLSFGSLVFICCLILSSVSYAQPVITSFSPASGAIGTQVNIFGANLVNTTEVTFNSIPAVIQSIGVFGQ